jgi:hypothetical protein
MAVLGLKKLQARQIGGSCKTKGYPIFADANENGCRIMNIFLALKNGSSGPPKAYGTFRTTAISALQIETYLLTWL